MENVRFVSSALVIVDFVSSRQSIKSLSHRAPTELRFIQCNTLALRDDVRSLILFHLRRVLQIVALLLLDTISVCVRTDKRFRHSRTHALREIFLRKCLLGVQLTSFFQLLLYAILPILQIVAFLRLDSTSARVRAGQRFRHSSYHALMEGF